jgi:hypothetical protein
MNLAAEHDPSVETITPANGSPGPGAVKTFCTYFDRRYLPRGVALYQSLRAHCPRFRLWVLCLDDACYQALSQLRLPDMQLISIAEFERGDVALQAAKTNRSLVEYYFTCTPSVALYVLRIDPAVDCVTYVDSDFSFFTDPSPMYRELCQGSIGIIRHRFPPRLNHLAEHGTFNVGLLIFRRDVSGLGCLQWWRDRCIEWCYDRVENGRFADQGYLNDWPDRFTNVVVLEHKGINLAPWNVSNYSIRYVDGTVLVDEGALICFHFQGLKRRYRSLYDLGLQPYGVRPNDAILRGIYAPYIAALEASATLAGTQAGSENQSRVNRTASHRPRLTAPLTRGTSRGLLKHLGDGRRIALGLPRRQYVVSVGGRLV